MNSFEFNCKPTIIGSMPHILPEKAVELILKYLQDIPAWPQLPKRASLEAMSVQNSRGFPGIIETGGKLVVDMAAGLEDGLERLYEAYLDDDYDRYGLTNDYAAGLHWLLNKKGLSFPSVKGQITGPISWCLSVNDSDGKSILYDEVLSDAAARMLALSARWQEKELERMSNNTLIFLDEPALSGYGSVFLNLSREKIIDLIRESLGKLQGLKGIHCCGNTDWSLIVESGADIISLDAYNYGKTVAIYPQELSKFVRNGGAIAWGIVPNNEPELSIESPASLKDRLVETIGELASLGNVSFRCLISASLITPSCSLSGLSEAGAEQALAVLSELSKIMKKTYL